MSCVTEEQATGNAAKKINGMQCRAVPFLIMQKQGLGGPESQLQIPSCAASACSQWRFAPEASILFPNGLTAVLDMRDSDLVPMGWWWAGKYARNKSGYLHRAVIQKHMGEIPVGMVVDHKDGDPLNNRFANLRVSTQAQNAANARPRGGKSKFRGVHKTRSGAWCAQIASRGTRETLGTFETELEAARAYDAAAERLHGEYARQNVAPAVDPGRLGYCGFAGTPITFWMPPRAMPVGASVTVLRPNGNEAA